MKSRKAKVIELKKMATAALSLALLLTILFNVVPAAAEAPASDEIVIEFEDMSFDTDDLMPSATSPYTHDALPVEAAVDFNVYGADMSLLCEFEVETGGYYMVNMDYIKNYNHGIFAFVIDGASCGDPVSFNNGAGGNWTLSSALLGMFRLEKGTHILKITGVEGDYYQGLLDCLRLKNVDSNITSVVFTFAGESFLKSSDFFLENPFPRSDELPVDSAIWVDFGKADEYFTGTIGIPASGKYDITLSFVLNNDSGVMKIEIDDVVIAPGAVLYHAGGWEASELHLGEFELTQGTHTLKVTCLESEYNQFHAWLHELTLNGIDLQPVSEPTAVPATEVPATPEKTAAPTAAPTDAVKPTEAATEAPAKTTEDPSGSGQGKGAVNALPVIIGVCCGVIAVAAVIIVAVIVKKKKS